MKIEYEEVLAPRMGQPPLPTAVACRLAGKVRLYQSADEGIAAADVEESASVAADLAGGDKAGALMKGSVHLESHTRIFGLSLVAMWAAYPILNATSPEQPDRDFGATSNSTISASRRGVSALEGGSHLDPFGTFRSNQYAAKQGGEEPGYQ